MATTRDYTLMVKRIREWELAEALQRASLLRRARAGHTDAIRLLRERYRLSLPMGRTEMHHAQP